MFALEAEHKVLAIKPMNCPAHVQIFNQHLHSYRDLPLRMAEFGSCHRNEPSGALHGLMRVRAFTQDDAHIFCTAGADHRRDRWRSATLLQSVYRDFGFDEVRVNFADRPPVRAGDDAIWDRAEQALREAVAAAGLETELNPGEGAFYGPKLEFVLRDAIGREWQCGTLQVDFVLPERLKASYIAEDGQKHRPVMLHRAILGSLERFIGVVIEDHAGRLPLWLAPVQVVVATITNDSDDYAREVGGALAAGRAARRARPRQRQDRLQGAPALARQGAADRGGRRARGRARHGLGAPARRAEARIPCSGRSAGAICRGIATAGPRVMVVRPDPDRPATTLVGWPWAWIREKARKVIRLEWQARPRKTIESTIASRFRKSV